MRQQWEKALPGILGGLLGLAAAVHQRLETISIDQPPRMADFGRTLAAVDEVLATEGLRRYMSRADQLSEDSLSADPFIERLRLQIREPIVDQSGGDLLAITTPVGDWRRPKEWPKNGRDVTAILRRHAPALRSLGWVIEDDGARNHRNVLLWTIYPPQQDSTAKRDSQSSRSSLSRLEGGACSAQGNELAAVSAAYVDDDLRAEAS
jgi:hypothetical protein